MFDVICCSILLAEEDCALTRCLDSKSQLVLLSLLVPALVSIYLRMCSSFTDRPLNICRLAALKLLSNWLKAARVFMERRNGSIDWAIIFNYDCLTTMCIHIMVHIEIFSVFL